MCPFCCCSVVFHLVYDEHVALFHGEAILIADAFCHFFGQFFSNGSSCNRIFKRFLWMMRELRSLKVESLWCQSLMPLMTSKSSSSKFSGWLDSLQSRSRCNLQPRSALGSCAGSSIPGSEVLARLRMFTSINSALSTVFACRLAVHQSAGYEEFFYAVNALGIDDQLVVFNVEHGQQTLRLHCPL